MFKTISNFERKRQIIDSFCEFHNLNNFIDELIVFLEGFSDLLIFNGTSDVSYFKGYTVKLGATLIDSATHTLNSIKIISSYGNISDIYTLLRKYRDDLFMYLYFLEIHNRYLEDEKKFDSKELTKQEEHLVKWNENELKYLNIQKNFEFLENNKTINSIIEKHNFKAIWSDFSKLSNNFVHSNGRIFVLKNFCDSINFDEDFKEISNSLLDIFYIFISILILIKPHFTSSTDYIDCLELEIKPEEGSQYYLAPLFQDFIDKHLEIRFENIKLFLKHNTYMKIK